MQEYAAHVLPQEVYLLKWTMMGIPVVNPNSNLYDIYKYPISLILYIYVFIYVSFILHAYLFIYFYFYFLMACLPPATGVNLTLVDL